MHFLEENGTQGVHGVYSVGYRVGDTWHDTTTPPGAASQLELALPAGWSGWVSAEIRTLPVLTPADVHQLRRHFTTGEGILASGQRAAEPNQAMDEIAPRDGELSLTVRIPVVKTVVTAASADALVAAVFPGGQLAPPGAYDCRRLPGTDDFEVVVPGWPGSFDALPGGTS